MEGKLKEKQKHIEFLYDELDNKDKELDKLQDALNNAKNLYKKQTAFSQEVLEDKNELSVRLENLEKDFAELKMVRCEKGCDKYNKSVDEIAEVLQNTGKS